MFTDSLVCLQAIFYNKNAMQVHATIKNPMVSSGYCSSIVIAISIRVLKMASLFVLNHYVIITKNVDAIVNFRVLDDKNIFLTKQMSL